MFFESPPLDLVIATPSSAETRAQPLQPLHPGSAAPGLHAVGHQRWRTGAAAPLRRSIEYMCSRPINN